MMPPITFFVAGLPKTAGSKRAFMRPGMKHPVVVEDCAGSKDWRASVAHEGTITIMRDRPGLGPLDCPLKVRFAFILPRLKGHYRANGQLKPNHPVWHATRPDLLKMARAAEDALTGICYRDDGQICHETLTKQYGDNPGVRITIEEAGE
jgi:Holliday junction resolvase RusA-like endonuclease